jgi:non-specific serine/threonine protein kinase
LEAAEEICSGDSGDLVSRAQVVNLLTSLVDKSLVSAEATDERTRYGLLESVREFARERLEEAGETSAFRRRHRDYYLKYGLREGVGMFGDVRTGVRRFQEEQGNLRFALANLVEEPEGVEGGLRLVPSLVHLWSRQEKLKEGGRFIAGLLKRAGPETDSSLVTQAKQALGRLHRSDSVRGEPPVLSSLPAPATTAALREGSAPVDRIRESKRTAQQSGDGLKAALCSYYLADASLRKGDLAGARAGFQEAAEGFRATGDDTWVAACFERLGDVALREGVVEEAHTCWMESLRLYRAVAGASAKESAVRVAGLLGGSQGVSGVSGPEAGQL